MNLAEITDRIANIQVDNKPLFTGVLTALDPDLVIKDGIVRQDTAFVIPVREAAPEGERQTYGYSQQIKVIFGIMIGVRSINDRLGSNINERLQRAIDEVRNAMLGWEPTDHDPITFLEGEVVAFLKGGAFWMEQYQTSHIYDRRNNP